MPRCIQVKAHSAPSLQQDHGVECFEYLDGWLMDGDQNSPPATGHIFDGLHHDDSRTRVQACQAVRHNSKVRCVHAREGLHHGVLEVLAFVACIMLC